MPLSPRHRLASAYGADISWANTPDRTARTAPARTASPSSDDYWIAQKRSDPKFADATDDAIIAAARSAKRAYYRQLAFKSAKARSRDGAA